MVSGTISRCCGRKYGGSSRVAKAHSAHGRLAGVEEDTGPRTTLQGAGSWLQGTPSSYFSSPVVFPPGIASHISAFPNTKVSGSLPRDCLHGVHASPIIIILLLLLQRASRTSGTSTTQLKPHWDTTEGSRFTTFSTISKIFLTLL